MLFFGDLVYHEDCLVQVEYRPSDKTCALVCLDCDTDIYVVNDQDQEVILGKPVGEVK